MQAKWFTGATLLPQAFLCHPIAPSASPSLCLQWLDAAPCLDSPSCLLPCRTPLPPCRRQRADSESAVRLLEFSSGPFARFSDKGKNESLTSRRLGAPKRQLCLSEPIRPRPRAVPCGADQHLKRTKLDQTLLVGYGGPGGSEEGQWRHFGLGCAQEATGSLTGCIAWLSAAAIQSNPPRAASALWGEVLIPMSSQKIHPN